MPLYKTSSGRILKAGVGQLAKSANCCCKCVEPYLPCEDPLVCTLAGLSSCCYRCGDPVNVTFGTVTAGTGADPGWTVGAGLVAAALSGQTIAARVDFGAGSIVYYSPPLGTDGTWWYGAYVLISAIQGGLGATTTSDMLWDVEVYVYRVSDAAYRAPGSCEISGVQFIAQSDGPATAAGNCCGASAVPMLDTDGYLTVVEPVSVEATSCNGFCSCADFADSYAVAAGCFTGAVSRSDDECQWTASEETGSLESCTLVQTSVTLRHQIGDDPGNPCGWIIEVQRTVYEPVDMGEFVDCVPNPLETIVAVKNSGADPAGVYTVVSGAWCGTEITVS